MSDPFVAEIRIFGFNFAPTGWALCDGQILPISQNTALFSLLGTTYGGNGTSNFALPNLQGSVPLHVGASQPGPGMQIYNLGQTGGEESVTLQQSEMPVHNHSMNAVASAATTASPVNAVLATPNYVSGTTRGTAQAYAKPVSPAPTAVPDTQLTTGLNVAGGSQPHNTVMPTLVLNFCIALQGIFPARP